MSEDVQRVTVTPETPDPDKVTLPSDQPEGSELLAGKFKTPEELVKGYKELEKKLGQRSAEPPKEQPKKTPNAELQIDEKAAEKAVAKAGLDMDVFANEFAETGELSEDSFAKLEGAGIPKAMVEGYIAGQKALAEATHARVKGYAGGEENYNAMISWAAENLSAEDIAAFNTAIAEGPSAQRLAVQGLAAQFQAEVGKNPQLLKGSTAPPAHGGYESAAQMHADMKDPRYKSDPAFRAKVMDKIKRSPNI
jgi:hypothetical protein